MAQIRGIEDSQIHAEFSTPASVDTPELSIALDRANVKADSVTAGDEVRLGTNPISALRGRNIIDP